MGSRRQGSTGSTIAKVGGPGTSAHQKNPGFAGQLLPFVLLEKVLAHFGRFGTPKQVWTFVAPSILLCEFNTFRARGEALEKCGRRGAPLFLTSTYRVSGQSSLLP